MRIPKRFRLFGRVITVELDPSLYHNEDVLGLAKYRSDKIILQPNTEHTQITREQMEHSFFHELVHHVLYAAGEDVFDPPLHKREYLVERIAGLLHQAVVSSEYEDLDNEQKGETEK